jgi:carboxylesterase
MSVLQPRGEAFLHVGGPVGCLVIHGFTGAPAEMCWFGQQMAQAGYSVVGVRLFAHATQPEDMFRARPQDWVASVEDGYHLLRGLSEQVVVMGLSLGGILALHCASRRPVAGVVAMSVPYVLMAPWVKRIRPLLPAVSKFVPYMEKGAPDWRDPRLAEDHLEYPKHPVRAAASLVDVHAEMLRRLPLITAPALMIASHGDATAPPWHSQTMFDRLRTADKRFVLVENSGHIVTRDLERSRVAEAATAFVRRVTGWPASPASPATRGSRR